MFEYFNGIRTILKEVEEKESENIKLAINAIVKAIDDKKAIFVFGASHAGIITQELFYRAGGLIPINPIFDESLEVSVEPITKTSKVEKIDGYGEIVASNVPFQTGDVILIHSVSGRNPVVVDLAKKAKEKGVRIICLTNLKYSKSVNSRHKTGDRLFECSDIIIDNHGHIGDGMISFKEFKQKVGPTSTVIGATIVNTIVVETVRKLIELGHSNPPIFYSANLDGGFEKNSENIRLYRETIHYKF